MRNLLLVITLVGLAPGIGLGQKQGKGKSATPRSIVAAFYDEGRTARATQQDFEFFFKPVQEILKRDFPGVEFRVVKRGEVFPLPDGTGLNVETMHPPLGYVLSARGRKRRVMGGLQSDTDIACAAATFFHRSTSACPHRVKE